MGGGGVAEPDTLETHSCPTFRRYIGQTVWVYSKGVQKYLGTLGPRPLGTGCACPLETSPRVIRPNFVALDQTVWAQVEQRLGEVGARPLG